MALPRLALSKGSRAHERARFVLRLLPFRLWIGIGDDAGGRLDVHLAAFDDRGADGDRDIHVAVEAEITDGAAVDAALHRLELIDELHRAHLRCAGDRARRKARLQYIDGVAPRGEAPLDVRD